MIVALSAIIPDPKKCRTPRVYSTATTWDPGILGCQVSTNLGLRADHADVVAFDGPEFSAQVG
jgi:hypothetical protein